MFNSAFCTHWKQKHRPHSEDFAPSNHRWGGTFSEVGRKVPVYQIGSNGSINNYHFTDEFVLTEGEIVQYGTTTGGFQQNFGSIYQLQQRVLRPFTVIFHARVWANL